LCSANLTDVDLSGADLTNADLTDANLAGTDISVAETKGANLYQVNWDGGERKQEHTSRHWVTWSGK
jgi:uncharacterized protein YjbI with pentapeptide repeats